MRNYTITNFLCDKTYGGVMCFSDMASLNDTMIHSSLLTLEKHYGTNRPFETEMFPSKEGYPKHMFIAWLEGTPDIDEKDPRNFDEDGDEVHGFHLFVIGFTSNPETCVDDIYRMGDKYFEEKSKGFLF